MTSPQYQQQSDQQAPAAPSDPAAQPLTAREARRSPSVFRAFQVLAAAGGAILFVMGIVAVFRVEFGAGFFETSGSVAGFGFSPALAIACVLLGGAILATSLADQDRGGTAFAALLTLAVGIGALVLEGGADQVGVDRQSALLMVVIGAIVFVLSLLPWWSRRRLVVAP